MAFEENWANDYLSSLAAPMAPGDTSLQVASAAGAPAPPFRLKIVSPATANERILITGVAGTTFSFPLGNRGQGGTSAVAHAQNDVCGNSIDAEGLTLGLVRQILAGASGNLSLSPAGGQGAVTADIVQTPVFTGLATAAGLRDSRGVAGFNVPFIFARFGPLGGTQAAPISFTGIPQTGSILEIAYQLRSDQAVTHAALGMQLNTDAGGNYYSESVFNNAASTAAGAETLAASSAGVGLYTGTSADANFAESGRVFIPNYADTHFTKTWNSYQGGGWGVATGKQYQESKSGRWNSTAGITRIDLLGPTNFVAGSWACLIIWP